MRSQYVMFLGLILAAGTIISLTFGGKWLGSSDLDVVNSLSVFKDANILGLWSISIPNVDFFFTGMKSLIMLDFGFFESGGLMIVQWMMFLTVGLGALWGMYTVIISVVQSAIGRR